MQNKPDCKAIRFNDEICCARCGLSWAIDDTEPPECKEMMIPPVSPVARVEPRLSKFEDAPDLNAFIFTISNLKPGAPAHQRCNVLVFARDDYDALRLVEQLVGRAELIPYIYFDHCRAPQFDAMAQYGSRRIVFTTAELSTAIERAERFGKGHKVALMTGMQAVKEVRSW